MVRIQLFGMVDLRAPGPAGGQGLLHRPKLVALLAYLLLAQPRGFHRRDEIVARFWPESDHAHARAALRQALHQLRRALGTEAVSSRGDDEVAIATDAVWCDVLAFERAIEGGRLADALELYRGPLLSAFHVPALVEVERWLERERERLGRRAVVAASVLAERAEAASDAAAAVTWAGRILELAPHDEDALRTAMRCLALGGSPVEALRACEAFAVRLREELELEVSAETRALEASIRARVGSAALVAMDRPAIGMAGREPAGSRVRRRRAAMAGTAALAVLALLATFGALWRPVGPALQPHRLAVLPFAVSGGHDVEYLREGLADVLGTRLDGAGELAVVDANALIGALRGAPADRIDPVRGREIALRFGAGLYVLGNVLDSGGRLRGKASLYGTDHGLYGTAEVVVESEDHLFELVDGLARELLAMMPFHAPDRLLRLAAVTTDSFPALKAYLAGEWHLREGRPEAAVAAYGRSIAADTAFALAYYRMAVAQHQSAVPLGVPGAHERATALAHRLAPRDRLMLSAFDAQRRHRYAEAERLYREVLSIHPDEVEAWVFLAQVLARAGLWQGRSTAEVRYALERALALDPDHMAALNELSWVSAMEERFDEVAALTRRMLALQPGGYLEPALRVRLALLQGERREIDRALEELRGLDAPYLNWAQRSAWLSGNLEGRRCVAQLLTEPGRSDAWRALGHMVSARVDLDRGRPEAALRELGHLREIDPDRYILARARFQSRTLIPWPDTAMAGIVDLLEPWRPATPELRLARLYLLGLIQVQRGQREAAERMARALEAQATALQGSAAHPEVGLARDLALGLRAWHAAGAGDHHGVLRLLDAMQPADWWRGSESGGMGADALQTWLRAEALAAVGRDTAAVRLLEPMGWLWGDAGLLATKHRRMAEAYTRLGDGPRAAHHFDRLASLWQDAEPALRAGGRGRAPAPGPLCGG
jgi:DNA-binding SARP family transcriptional activator/TolB-like protein